MTERALLTVAQIAGRLQVRRETVRLWLQRGRLRGTKLPGGDWRVRHEDLDEVLEHPKAEASR